MTVSRAQIARRTALGIIGGGVLTACQGGPSVPPPVAVGTSPTTTAPPAERPVVLSSENFGRWLDGARAEATKRGIGAKTVHDAFTDIQPIPRVVELDRRQPEFSQTFSRYLTSAVSDRRVTDGRTQLTQRASLLAGLEHDYQVPGRFLVAFWGLETNYGRVTGEYPVIAALATLAFDGRRSAFFREEMFNALKIADAGHIGLADMRGSWAGAMGHTQFMPSTFLRHAVDRDGDKHINIWASVPDALGSAANYLHSLGWDEERTWGREVKMPTGFDVNMASLDVDAKENILPLTEWSVLGIRRTDGGALPKLDVAASLVLPQGVKGPAFLVYENYRAILKWNRSAFYAIAVGHLADRLVGGPGLSVPADTAQPLRREEVVALQEGLITQKFLEGPADGAMGSGTRQAVRRFQKAHGLPPDGYADRALIAAVTGT